MVTIKIGNDSRSLDQADEAWITQQVNRRQKDGLPVCVQITIKEPGFDLILTTPDCGGGGGGGRAPRPEERAIFDLWGKRGLNSDDFSGGNLLAFIKQLRNLL